MATLAELRSDVQEIVIDLTDAASDANVDKAIQKAQRDLEDAHEFSPMEATFSFVCVVGSSEHANYSKPATWLRSRVDVGPLLYDTVYDQAAEIDWLISEGDRARLEPGSFLSPIPSEFHGKPKYIQELATSFRVLPAPDAVTWTILVPYYKRLDTLSSDTSQNWFTTNAEKYLVFRAASRILALNRDWDEAAFYDSLATNELRRAILSDKKLRAKKRRLLRPVSGAKSSSFQPRRLR